MTLTPIAERFSCGAVITCFYDLGLSRLGFENPTFRLRGERSNPLGQRRGMPPSKALSIYFSTLIPIFTEFGDVYNLWVS